MAYDSRCEGHSRQGAGGIRRAVRRARWGLLESALGRPQNLFHYGEKVSLCQLAASHCYGIVRNHPFIDGNKRTGFVMARVFLQLNGVRFSPAQGEPARIIRALAASEIDEAELVRWFEDHSAVS